MWTFFLGGTCAGGVGANGALAGFGVGAGAGGLGLGEDAGGGVAGEEVEGEGEALADDACSFANRFMRICGGNRQSAHTWTRTGDATRTRSASLVGSVKDWLELMITAADSWSTLAG